MSELHVGYQAHSTEDVLHQIQSTLQPFVERPEKYNFSSFDTDRHMVVCGGVGSVILGYNHRNMAQVCFQSERGFDVTAAYRLHTGIWVDPLKLHEIGALSVQYPARDGPLYWPKMWPDHGYSLQNPMRENLDVGRVWHMSQAIGELSTAFSQPNGVRLSVVE